MAATKAKIYRSRMKLSGSDSVKMLLRYHPMYRYRRLPRTLMTKQSVHAAIGVALSVFPVSWYAKYVVGIVGLPMKMK